MNLSSLDQKLIEMYIAIGIYGLMLVLIALPTLLSKKKR